EAAQFPDWGKMRFHDFPRREWDAILPTASESARDMVAKLVRYESGRRLTAAE
ncbi:mitogen-activated protein kinase, partial [Cryomyces antarcticus]